MSREEGQVDRCAILLVSYMCQAGLERVVVHDERVQERRERFGRQKRGEKNEVNRKRKGSRDIRPGGRPLGPGRHLGTRCNLVWVHASAKAPLASLRPVILVAPVRGDVSMSFALTRCAYI